MDKIESFLSSYEAELDFEKTGIEEEINRIDRQVEEFRRKIDEIRKAKDLSYEVFSASQSGNNGDTEAEAMNQLVSDKIQIREDLTKKLLKVNEKLCEVRELDYHTASAFRSDDIIMKLQRIYKWIPVDPHRAQEELQQILRNLQMGNTEV